MARPELIVGLDIGTTKVCACIAEVGDGGLGALGVGVAPSTGLRRGVVVDVDATAAAIRKSIDDAQKQAGAEIRSAIVGITGEHISSLNARGVVAVTNGEKAVTREDVDRVLENARLIVLPPDREIVHAIPRGFSLDGLSGIKNPVGMYGARLEVESHIVTGLATFLRNVAVCVERAGIGIEEFVLEPVATAEAVLLPAERNLGAAVLDIGGGTADLAVYRGGQIHFTAVIPIAGEYVTRDIAVALRSTLEEAERVKREHGFARASLAPADDTFTYQPLGDTDAEEFLVRDLAEVIEARVAEMLEMVRAEMVRGGLTGASLPGGVALSGGGAMLNGLAPLAQQILGLPVRIGRPSIAGAAGARLAEAPFATVVGLVQWGAAGIEAPPSRRSTLWMNDLWSWFRRLVGDR